MSWALRGGNAGRDSGAQHHAFLFGGVAQIGAEPPSAVAEFLIAVAGPLVSLVLAVLFYVVQPLVAGMEPVLGLADLADINLALVLFNLIPGYLLDGGRVFRGHRVGDHGKHAPVTPSYKCCRFFAFLFDFTGVCRCSAATLAEDYGSRSSGGSSTTRLPPRCTR